MLEEGEEDDEDEGEHEDRPEEKSIMDEEKEEDEERLLFKQSRILGMCCGRTYQMISRNNLLKATTISFAGYRQ